MEAAEAAPEAAAKLDAAAAAMEEATFAASDGSVNTKSGAAEHFIGRVPFAEHFF